MRVIEKLRYIWMRYGSGFKNLSPYEQDEFIHSAWIFVIECGTIACIGTFIVILEQSF